MGFSKVNHDSVFPGDFNGLRQIVFYLCSVVILKQLGIGPVQVGGIQDIPCDGDAPAEPLHEKNRIRKLFSNHSNHICPCRNWYHVSRIATETINTPATPQEKNVSHVLPQVFVGVIKFCQIGPGNTPRARGFNSTVRVT